MPNTLKDLAASAKLVSQTALEQALTDLKNYIDTQDTAGSTAASQAAQAVSDRLNALIGAQNGDLDTVINTFNEVKAFLADYDEDDTLKNLIDAATAAAESAASTAEQNAKTYADNLNTAMNSRVSTLEGINVMTAAEAHTLYSGVFNPAQAEE